MVKVDIVMGIYNCEQYLAESIESIINQSFKDWRLIMCDDKSTDGTLKIAERFAKKYPKKIILLKNNRNMGLNYTLNKCLKNATAEYIARQDGDDISMPDRLKKEVIYLDSNPEMAFVSSDAKLFDGGGVWGKTNYSENPTKYDFLSISPFCHAAVLIRRNVLMDVGGYTVDDRLLRVEDYYLWFQLYSKEMFGHNLKDYLYAIRDDRNAAKRRTWTNRKNEYYVRRTGYKMLKIPRLFRLYRFRPILLGLLPSWFSGVLHKGKLGTNDEK